MSTAGELLSTMKVRLQCQKKGITDPPDEIKAATEALVNELSSLDSEERIDVVVSNRTVAYVRALTGETIVRIHSERFSE